jgi:hypothetical protein
MAEMKKIFFLSGKARNDEPPLFLSIFIWVLFLTTPLSGLLHFNNILDHTERHFHDNPQGFFTFYALFPDKISFEDTTSSRRTPYKISELSLDTTAKASTVQKNINVVIK